MKPLRHAAAALALIAGATACQVNVDNKSKENVENAADSAGAALGNAADVAGNVAGAAAAKIENAADTAANKVKGANVHVNLSGGDDGNKAADRGSANKAGRR
jgi:hypothetical protein